MSQAPIFRFDNYIVRPVAETDRPYIDQLITADPYHKGMTAGFFLELLPGEDAWAIEDEQGRVMLYFKTQTACRVSLQFGDQNRHRNLDVLLRGMAWIESMLRSNRFREILFQTDGPELRNMAKRRMGFRETSGDLVRGIAPPKPIEGCKGPWESSPQASQGEVQADVRRG
jgi:hypothetical protein